MSAPTEAGREEKWRQFYADQLERQARALETTAKKVGTIEAVVSVWLVLSLLAGVVLLIAALSSHQ